MDAAQHLHPALATVKEHVEVPGGVAEVVQQRRCVGVEGGENQALVAVQLGHRGEAPLGLVQLAVVGVLEVGNGLEGAVVAESPAVVGADKRGGVSGVGAAEPVAAVAADVQEGSDLAGPVADDQHRVLAHVGGEEIAGVGDLCLVAEEQPAAGKDLLQFLLVYLLIGEDAGVDYPVLRVDQSGHWCQCHGNLLAW